MRIAAVVHVYYEALWPELTESLRNIGRFYDLFVTIPEDSRFGEVIIRDFPMATLISVPNVGRDVLPFISLLPELQRFDVVCKMHTKGNHNGTGRWRQNLLEGVAGSARLVDRILRAFERQPNIVMAGSRRCLLDGHQRLSGNRARMERLAGPLPDRFGFFCGTMFWLRPQIVADFPQMVAGEPFRAHSVIDGEPEHALERLFGMRASQRGTLLAAGLDKWFGWPKVSERTYR